MKKLISLLGTALALSAITTEARAEFTCSGKVEALKLYPSGLVAARVGTTGLIYMCMINSNLNWNDGYAPVTITPEVCKTMYSAFLSARLSGQQITLWYVPATGQTACNQLTGWPAYAPASIGGDGF